MAYDLTEEIVMTTTSSCDSCGMPIESGRYCSYCTGDSGTLQLFEERFARMAGADPSAPRGHTQRGFLASKDAVQAVWRLRSSAAVRSARPRSPKLAAHVSTSW